MILRDARSDDETALESFDLGNDRSPWLDDVAEIVSGPIAWRDDAEQTPLDRRVVVGDDDGEIVAVAAHERIEHERLGPLAEHRYLMVVAVRADRQRSGVARVLSESLISECSVTVCERSDAGPPVQPWVDCIQPFRIR